MGIFTPSPTINYNFVAGVYSFFAVLCVILYALTHFTDAVKGFYIVLVPFLPCVCWSFVVRHQWLKLREDEAATAKTAEGEALSEEKDAETKKDK
ncbi:TPA: hypothetical protein N0F65_010930 [Lagenidium giganteum]|uniref:Uncharacterized protein n=1 Tax=Lagenidium giganteum TaxID=4803 RepID=A0AAV2Z2T3_9STRA|nr:TPA: hypothetical protein N0F65_010930 [Lagenidium giganteum]